MGQASMFKILSTAWKRRAEGDYATARKLAFEVQNKCNPDDHLILGRVYHIYMQIEADHDNYLKAVVHSKESIKHYKLSHQTDRIAHATRHLADLQRELGKNQKSHLNYLKSLDYYKHDLDVSDLDLANALRGYALILEKIDKKPQAIQAWEKVKALYSGLQLNEGVHEATESIKTLRDSAG